MGAFFTKRQYGDCRIYYFPVNLSLPFLVQPIWSQETAYRSRFDVERRRAAFIRWVELAGDEVESVAFVETSETLPPRL